jgi:hypothetical protein
MNSQGGASSSLSKKDNKILANNNMNTVSRI